MYLKTKLGIEVSIALAVIILATFNGLFAVAPLANAEQTLAPWSDAIQPIADHPEDFREEQATGSSCWAAVSRMLLKLYGTHNDFVPPFVEDDGVPSQIQIAMDFHYYGLPGLDYYRNGLTDPTSWSIVLGYLGALQADPVLWGPGEYGRAGRTIVSDINNDHPLVLCLSLPDPTNPGGEFMHNVLVFAYDNFYEDDISLLRLGFLDPRPGLAADFVNWTSYDQIWDWMLPSLFFDALRTSEQGGANLVSILFDGADIPTSAILRFRASRDSQDYCWEASVQKWRSIDLTHGTWESLGGDYQFEHPAGSPSTSVTFDVYSPSQQVYAMHLRSSQRLVWSVVEAGPAYIPYPDEVELTVYPGRVVEEGGGLDFWLDFSGTGFWDEIPDAQVEFSSDGGGTFVGPYYGEGAGWGAWFEAPMIPGNSKRIMITATYSIPIDGEDFSGEEKMTIMVVDRFASIRLDPDDNLYYHDINPVGTHFEVSIVVDAVELTAFDFSIGWNPSHLYCTGRSTNIPSPFTISHDQLDQTSGNYRLAASSAGSWSASTPQQFCTLTFRTELAPPNGSLLFSFLDIHSTSMTTLDGEPLQHSVNDGYFFYGSSESSRSTPDWSISPSRVDTWGRSVIHWFDWITFTFFGEPGIQNVSIHLSGWGFGFTSPMTQIHVCVWQYSYCFFPYHDLCNVEYIAHYADNTTVSVNSQILIDPSGYVYDALSGKRIEGATATLSRLNDTSQEFLFVDPLDPGIEPHVNPQVTNDRGGYGWNVSAGTYHVTVEKEGYFLNSANVTIPPPAFDVNIPLTPIDPYPPLVGILTPSNRSYGGSSVPLYFFVSEETAWMGCIIDDGALQTIGGNTTLTSLTDGAHSIIVCANDTYGNIGFSHDIHFSIDTTAPVADAGIDQTIELGTMVMLNGSQSYDDIHIVGYTWVFVENNETRVLIGRSPEYLFNHGGDFEVVLNVTDDADNWDTDSLWIHVTGGRDVAVVGVSLSKTTVGQGYMVSVNITIENQGTFDESVSASVYANSTLIHAFAGISLSNGTSSTLAFSWNTTGSLMGDYSIIVSLAQVPGEVDLADNTGFANHLIFVTIVGDVDGDRDVDIFDIVLMAGVYGDYIPSDWPLPAQDIDGDRDVDIFDIVIAAGNYGESW